MIDAERLVNRVKTELRIANDDDDARVALLIEEAAQSLQRFKDRELVDVGGVTDPVLETALTPLDIRYIAIYVALAYDGPDDGLDRALGNVLEVVREK